MATDVYERLAAFLDDLPAGFPATDGDPGYTSSRFRPFWSHPVLRSHLSAKPEAQGLDICQ